jgi:hypothetical protein
MEVDYLSAVCQSVSRHLLSLAKECYMSILEIWILGTTFPQYRAKSKNISPKKSKF